MAIRIAAHRQRRFETKTLVLKHCYPDLPFLAFWISLFFFCKDFLAFLSVFFPSFPRILGFRLGRKILAFRSFSLFCLKVQSLMYSRKGVVYKLHAGWFISRTPEEFINSGPFVRFKGLLCGNPMERGESLKLNF